MRALLTSSGLSTPGLRQELAELVGKPAAEISAGVINEAMKRSFGDRHGWFFDEMRKIEAAFGGVIDFIDLQANDAATVREQMADKDVIYCMGGNSDYLMHVFTTTGFDETLRGLLTEKVYVGTSAGASVLGHRISWPPYLELRRELPDHGVERYLEVVPFGIVPHVGNPQFPGRTREAVERMFADCPQAVVALADDQAIRVDGSSYTAVGGEVACYGTPAPSVGD